MAFLFAPMNHSLGRYTLYAMLGAGSTAYFTQRADLSAVLEELRLARPIHAAADPAAAEPAQQHCLAEVGRPIAAGEDVDTEADAVRVAMRVTFFGDRLTSASMLRALVADIFAIPVS